MSKKGRRRGGRYWIAGQKRIAFQGDGEGLLEPLPTFLGQRSKPLECEELNVQDSKQHLIMADHVVSAVVHLCTHVISGSQDAETVDCCHCTFCEPFIGDHMKSRIGLLYL